MLAAVVTKEATTSYWVSFQGWPEWLQVLAGTVMLVVALWIFAKVVKWSLYILIWLVLIGGLAATAWLIFK